MIKWFYLLVMGFVLAQLSISYVALDLYRPGSLYVSILGIALFSLAAFCGGRKL